MKKIYLLFLFSFISILAFSQQDGILNESFESTTFPPKDWKLVKVSGTSNSTWMRFYGGTTESSYCAWISQSNSNDSWLITPQLKPSEENHILTFWVKAGFTINENLTFLNVKVSTAKGEVKDFEATPIYQIASVDTEGTGMGIFSLEWTQYSVDLSTYKDQGIFIGFQYVNNSGVGVRLDEITGIPHATFDNELVVSSISLPLETDFKYIGEQIDIPVKIKNLGIATSSNVPVTFYVDEVELTTETVTIPASDSATVTVQWTATAGTHYIKAVIPDDDNNINNELLDIITIYSAGTLLESFEGTAFPPTHWTSDGSWMLATYNQTHGSKCAGVFSSNKKLITPKVNIASGDSLTFQTKSSATTSIGVLISSDMQTWDTLAIYQGTSDVAKHAIYFDAENNSEYFGQKYFAFVVLSQYGTLYLDLVYGPQLVPITKDFGLVSFSKSSGNFLQEDSPIDYTVIVQNKTATEQSSEVYLKNGAEILVTGTSKLLKQGEIDTITMSWTPDKGYPNLKITATLPADDAEGNNFLSQNYLIYPKNPQSLPFTSNFDNSTTLPDYWYSDIVSSTGWTVASGSLYSPTITPHSGQSVLKFACYSKDTISLSSHFVSLPYDKYKVSFWLYRDATSYQSTKEDALKVYVNETPDAISAQLIGSVHRSTLLEPVVDTAGWYYYEFFADCRDLNSGFFIFEGISLTSYQNIYIDDLSIEVIPPYDGALIDKKNAENIVWGNNEVKHDVVVTLKNEGSLDLNAATIHWSLNGDEQSDYIWNGALSFRDSVDVIVAENVILEAGQNYTIVASVAVQNDTTSGNDSIEYIVNAKQTYSLPYVNSFEDAGLSLTDWLNWDVDNDTLSWAVSTENPYGGNSSIISSSYDIDKGELTPDNWLVSPGFNIEHDRAFLSFYVGAGDETYFEEKYEILISTTSPDRGEFVSIYNETLSSSSAYKKIELNLDGYKDKTLFVAFRHYDTSAQYYLTIDSVALYYPTLYTVQATPNPAEGGTVTGAGKYLVNESVQLTAIANEGYNFINWAANGSAISTESAFNFSVISDTALVANFEKIKYTITASVEGAGSISPTGSVFVDYQESQIFQILPSEGSKVDSVLVDGVNVGAVESYTFNNVTSNHTIKAIFGLVSGLSLQSNANLVVYPNPFVDVIKLENISDAKYIRIINSQGITVYSKLKDHNTDNDLIELNVPSGYYVLSITYTDGSVSTTKLIKQ